MATIKFSHRYTKLPPRPDPSYLLEVFVVDRSDLHSSFIDYDTHIVDGGNFKIPIGKVLVLLLQSESGAIWTTIRRFTDDKYEYYKSLRGRSVHIDIAEVNDSLLTYL